MNTLYLCINQQFGLLSNGSFFVDVPINSKTHLVLIFIGAIRPLKITMTVSVHPQVHEYCFSIFLFIY